MDDLRAKARGMQSDDPALPGSRGPAGRPAPTGAVKDWGGVAHADRPKQLEPLVNITFKRKPVPVPDVKVELGGKAGNRFDHKSWTIYLEDRFFADGIRQSEYDEMIRAMWHEADHVEAWYGMARAKGPEFKSPQELADAMDLRTPRAREAAVDAYAKPMKASDPQHAEMLRFWESVYGSGAKGRNQVFDKLDAAEKHMSTRGTVFEVAANKCETAPKVIAPEKRDELLRQAADAEEKWNAARADYEKAYKAYSELPEEARAFATEQWRARWAKDAVRSARVKDAESRLDFWRKRVDAARATRANYEAAHAEKEVLDEFDFEIATAQDRADLARRDLKSALLL
jgi:hypothetical protein